MSAVMDYISGSLEELNHVVWPTQQQAVRLTLITVVFIVISALFFGVVDGGLTEIIRITLR